MTDPDSTSEEDAPVIIPRPPAGLGAPGRALWRALAGDTRTGEQPYTFTPSELRILESAAFLDDVCHRLRAELKGAELTVRGSQGQPVAQPLIGELRATELAVRALLTSLRIPDDLENEAQNGQFTPENAAKMALKRRR